MEIQYKTNEQLQQELIELREENNSLKELYDKENTMCKKAYDEMFETNLKLTLAMKGGNMAWWEMDVPTGNVTFDKYKVEMLGYPPENFKHYKDFTALIHPNDSERIMNAMKDHLNGTLDQYKVEYRIMDSSGEYIWFYDYGSVVKRDLNGAPLICTGFVYNISERKNTEKRLLKIMKAIDSTSDAIGMSDKQGHHFYQNKALSDLFGFETAEELEAAGGGKVCVKDPAIAKKMFETLSTGLSWIGELEMVTKSGRVFPAYERADAIKDTEGNVIGVIGIITDITERKQAEDKLRKSDNMLQMVMDNFPGVVFWKDRQSKYLGCNQAFATGAGLKSSAEIIGKTDFEMPWASKEAIHYVKDDMDVMECGKGRLHIIETQHQSDGQVIWLNTNKLPLRYSSDEVIGIIGVSNDISTLKLAEQELITKNIELALKNEEKEKQAADLVVANNELVFLASNLLLVHEKERVNLALEIHDSLAQLLVALKMDIGMFKKKISKTNEAVNPEVVITEMEQLMVQVDNANKSARSIMNGLRPEQLEVLGFVAAAELHLSTFEQRHHLKCSFKNTVLDPIIHPDQALALFRILQESLNNIFKHAMATTVIVQLSNVADKLVLEINDNGIGFDVNKKGRPDSYGLIGMKERIKLLSGNLDITSKMGEGTSVRVEIPYGV